jgi:hypothetical protein
MLMADMRHRTTAKATDATAAKTTYLAAAKAAAHVAAAESATAESAAAVSSATTTAAAATTGLCTRGKQAAGKHCARQNHHHSSSHDILHWDGRTFPPQDWVRRRRVSQQDKSRRRDGLEIRMLAVAPIKFDFNPPALFRDRPESDFLLPPRTWLRASSDPRKPKFVFS